jgi:hypothetical protein
MISDNQVKYWFRQQLDSSSTIDMTNDVAYGNRIFDATDKVLWFRERYQVADEGIAGNQEDVKSALIWYDVIGQRGFGDDTIFAAAQEIADIFDAKNRKEQQVDSTTKLDVDVATTGVGSDYEQTEWLLPVRIEFRVYQVS